METLIAFLIILIISLGIAFWFAWDQWTQEEKSREKAWEAVDFWREATAYWETEYGKTAEKLRKRDTEFHDTLKKLIERDKNG